MRVTPLLAFAAGLAVAVLPSAPVVTAQPIGNPTPSPPPALGSHPSPLQPLEDRIGYLGETRYASTYAGVTLARGTLSVYVVPHGDEPFLNAVAALDTAHLPYTVQYVTRSLATQEATSKWISDHLAAIRAEGISPQWWGGENAQDAVRVALKGPVTSTQLAHLQAAMAQIRNGGLGQRALQLPAGTAVTPGNYSTVAVAVLNAQAPSPDDIVAGPSNLGAGHASNDWRNDNSPFYGADKLWYTLNNTKYCTGGFSVSGNGTNYMLTAGH